MTEERIAALDELGFEWRLKDAAGSAAAAAPKKSKAKRSKKSQPKKTKEVSADAQPLTTLAVQQHTATNIPRVSLDYHQPVAFSAINNSDNQTLIPLSTLSAFKVEPESEDAEVEFPLSSIHDFQPALKMEGQGTAMNYHPFASPMNQLVSDALLEDSEDDAGGMESVLI